MSDEELLHQRDQYWANAREAINGGEHRKAAELIWGAVAQQIKLVALSQERELGTHRQRCMSGRPFPPALVLLANVTLLCYTPFEPAYVNTGGDVHMAGALVIIAGLAGLLLSSYLELGWIERLASLFALLVGIGAIFSNRGK